MLERETDETSRIPSLLFLLSLEAECSVLHCDCANINPSSSQCDGVGKSYLQSGDLGSTLTWPVDNHEHGEIT